MIVLGEELRAVEGGDDIVGLRVVLELVGERDVVFEVGSNVAGFLVSVGDDDILSVGAIDGCVAIVGDSVPLFVEGIVGDNVPLFVEETVGALVISPLGMIIWLVQYRSPNVPSSASSFR